MVLDKDLGYRVKDIAVRLSKDGRIEAEDTDGTLLVVRPEYVYIRDKKANTGVFIELTGNRLRVHHLGDIEVYEEVG